MHPCNDQQLQRWRDHLLSWLLVLTVIVSILACVTGQATQPQSGCTFMDDQNVLNIEVLRGQHNTPCPSVSDFQDQFKVTEDTLSEMSYDVLQLQTQMLQLMDTSLNLTLELGKLTEELRATQYTLQTIDTALVDCPQGYSVHNPSLKSCYMFVSRPLSWFQGETFCMSTRGHLTSIDSQDEQDYIVSHIRSSNDLPGHHFWTGGNNVTNDNVWYWAGSNLPFNYTNWVPYPGAYAATDTDFQEHCMFLFHPLNYGWAWDICSAQEKYFICEYKLL